MKATTASKRCCCWVSIDLFSYAGKSNSQRLVNCSLPDIRDIDSFLQATKKALPSFHRTELSLFLNQEQAGSLLARLESATASWCFAAASRSSDFATASWFDFATAVATATTLAEQFAEQAFDLVSAARCVAARINNFATTSRCFATASRSSDFATASWFDDFAASVTAAVVLSEQFLQQAELRLATRAVATRVNDFAAASWCWHFAAASWFDVTTAITAVATKFVKQASVSAGGARSYNSKCQQGRNEYTTHRDISIRFRFWEGSYH